MQEEVIQQLHQQVQNLEATVQGQVALVEELRIVQQRQRSDVRDARSEAKSYGSMNADKIETLEDMVTRRFDDVYDKLEDLSNDVEAIKGNTESILTILRSNIKRAVEDPNTEE